MRHIIRKSIGAILFTGALVTANTTLAQGDEETTTTTTTTSAGTVSEFGPRGFVIKSSTSAEPLRYTSSKTTTYVDEDGNPVSVTKVKSGLPVTVYYTKVGGALVASKVLVRKVVTDSADNTESTQTTTTTSAGTISEFGPQRFVIKSESSPDPIRYIYSKKTTYVDENGAPVSITTVKSGLPVTVYYTKIGGTLTATKVIVRKAVAAPADVIEKKTTTTTTTDE